MNLIINKYDSEFKTKDNSLFEVLEWDKFKSLIRQIGLVKYFLKYDNIYLCIYKIETENNLLIILILMRCFSKKSIFIIENSGNETKVKLRNYILLFLNLITSAFYYLYIIFRVRIDIARLSSKYYKDSTNINEIKDILYLRTDFWFGIKAGGSIGHITGVINNFFNCNSNLNNVHFATTDSIPGVGKNIKTQIFKISPLFKEFYELKLFYSNFYFYNQLDKNIEANLIYQRLSLNNYLGLKLAKKLKIPLIIEYNGSEVWISRNWGKKLFHEKLSIRIEELVLKQANLIVVVSAPLKKELIERGINEKNILINPNGVDTFKYSMQNYNQDILRIKYNFTNDKVIIGFIGTFGPWHGAEILAEAFCLLIKDNPGFKNILHLLMIGDGIRLNNVKSIISLNSLDDFVTYTGLVPQNEGPNFLAVCDILVAPHVPNRDGSPFFGSPTKLFEYMSMSKGIVASELDQIGEILTHRETAYLVEPGNVTELSKGIYTLISDKNLLDKLGKNARKLVIEKYSWEIHTKKIFDKLVELTNK